MEYKSLILALKKAIDLNFWALKGIGDLEIVMW